MSKLQMCPPKQLIHKYLFITGTDLLELIYCFFFLQITNLLLVKNILLLLVKMLKSSNQYVIIYIENELITVCFGEWSK